MPLVNKTFSDIITFTRASTATYFDSAGVLQSAAIDAPRLDYNPATLAARGFLVEEARTNSIRNNTMVGAVAGTPGTNPTNWTVATGGLTGITQQIVGTGTESGITYLDIRFSGTPSAAGTYRIYTEGTVNIAALTGQTWSNSQYLKLAAGALTGVTGFTDVYQEFTSVGGFVTEASIAISSPTTASLATQRSATTRTLAGGATTAFVRSGLQLTLSGVAIDITLRIGLPQLEQGAFATSVIPTTTTSLTRSADVASVNTLSPWFNAAAGTLFAEFSPYASGTKAIVAINDGTLNNRIQFFANAGDPYTIASRLVSGGTATSPANSGSIAVGAVGKTALAYAVGTNQGATSVNGDAPTTSSPAAIAVGVNALELGKANSLSNMSGYLRRVTYYPRRLSNAELQALTA